MGAGGGCHFAQRPPVLPGLTSVFVPKRFSELAWPPGPDPKEDRQSAGSHEI